MKKIKIHSLPLKDVIKDLADRMDTDYTMDCNEYTLEIPSTYGTGRIVGIDFDGGLGLLIYKCEFHTDLEIRFTVDQVHPLKFLYCLEGSLEHHFEKKTEIHHLETYQNIIVASQNHDGHILKFKQDCFTEIYSLEIDRKVFKSKMSCALGKAKPNLQTIFEDVNAKKSFYYNGHYSLTLAEIFDDMKASDYDDFIGKMYSESQSYRMLTQQLIQFDKNYSQPNKNHIRKADLNALMEALDIIKNELESLGSISSIAKRVGLNNEKFQQGFKTLYGQTANEYIQSLRLNVARDLLIHTDDTIQEIKYKVGFNSHSYFSQLFKEVYDVSPSYFRRKNKKT